LPSQATSLPRHEDGVDWEVVVVDVRSKEKGLIASALVVVVVAVVVVMSNENGSISTSLDVVVVVVVVAVVVVMSNENGSISTSLVVVVVVVVVAVVVEGSLFSQSFQSSSAFGQGKVRLELPSYPGQH